MTLLSFGASLVGSSTLSAQEQSSSSSGGMLGASMLGGTDTALAGSVSKGQASIPGLDSDGALGVQSVGWGMVGGSGQTPSPNDGLLGNVTVGWGMLGGSGDPTIVPRVTAPAPPPGLSATFVGGATVGVGVSVSTFLCTFAGVGSLLASISISGPMPGAVFAGHADDSAALTVERHRTVTVLVTTGLAVDRSMNVPVNMDAGTGVRQPNNTPEDVVLARSARFS